MITMVVGPIIFVTVVGGIAGVDDLRKVGRIGVKSLIYFEGMTTVALVLGLLAIDLLHPGTAIHADPASLKLTGDAATYAAQGKAQGFWSILTEIVPPSALGAFSGTGTDLQVVFFSVLFGVAIKLVGEPARGVAAGVEKLGTVFFALLRIIMYAAPVGAFGAMAFTVGKYGVHTLTSLGSLIGLMYATSALFVVLCLGAVCAAFRLNILSLLRYIKDELLIVLGTSSSETVLPRLMRKIERAGVPEDVVGLTVPTGYSFNLDGTCIYLTLAALFVAQATGTHLSLGQQLGILGDSAADLEGRGRGDRFRLHRAGRDARLGRHDPGRRHHADLRHRPLHVHLPRAHQRLRQRGRLLRGRGVGGGARPGPGSRGAQRRARRGARRRGRRRARTPARGARGLSPAAPGALLFTLHGPARQTTDLHLKEAGGHGARCVDHDAGRCGVAGSARGPRPPGRDRRGCRAARLGRRGDLRGRRAGPARPFSAAGRR